MPPTTPTPAITKIQVEPLSQRHIVAALKTNRRAFRDDQINAYMTAGGRRPLLSDAAVDLATAIALLSYDGRPRIAYQIADGKGFIIARLPSTETESHPESDTKLKYPLLPFFTISHWLEALRDEFFTQIQRFVDANSRNTCATTDAQRMREQELQDKWRPIEEGLAKLEPEKMMEIDVLAVDPDHQNLGWGTALLLEVLREADARNMDILLTAGNPRSIHLYQTHGFVIQATCGLGGATLNRSTSSSSSEDSASNTSLNDRGPQNVEFVVLLRRCQKSRKDKESKV